jgi:hypothetical protein
MEAVQAAVAVLPPMQLETQALGAVQITLVVLALAPPVAVITEQVEVVGALLAALTAQALEQGRLEKLLLLMVFQLQQAVQVQPMGQYHKDKT